jgi:hypothetical protein
MNKGPSIVLRVLGLLLVLGLIAGAGAFGYRSGMARGIEQAPEVAAAIENAAESGQVAPIPPIMYGYGYPQMYGFHHPHFFNPFGAICFSFLFLFLFFGAMKMLFFRRMRHGWAHHEHGPWGRDWEGKVPPPFEEWHKRAHGETPTEEKPAESDKKE